MNSFSAGIVTDIEVDGDTSIVRVLSNRGLHEDFRAMATATEKLQKGDFVRFSRMNSLDGPEDSDDTVFCVCAFRKSANDNKTETVRDILSNSLLKLRKKHSTIRERLSARRQPKKRRGLLLCKI